MNKELGEAGMPDDASEVIEKDESEQIEAVICSMLYK